MAWQDEMIPILRGLILDIDVPYKYSDTLLTRVLLVATLQVSQELELGYTISIAGSSITPSIETDQNSQNLICLKAACLIQIDAANKAAEKGMKLKDDVGEIDTRDFSKHIVSILESGRSYCDLYEEARDDYITTGMYTMCTAVVGPIRQYYGKV